MNGVCVMLPVNVAQNLGNLKVLAALSQEKSPKLRGWRTLMGRLETHGFKGWWPMLATCETHGRHHDGANVSSI